MGFISALSSTMWAFLFLGWFGLPFALVLPTGLWATLRLENKRWTILEPRSNGRSSVPYFWLGLLGGIAGTFTAIALVGIGEWWTCLMRHQLCYDGQGAIALIFTIPLLSLIGSSISLGWTWMTLRLRADSLLASCFRYTGPHRIFQLSVSAAIPIIFFVVANISLIATFYH